LSPCRCVPPLHGILTFLVCFLFEQNNRSQTEEAWKTTSST
jgi:hypothetical protein